MSKYLSTLTEAEIIDAFAVHYGLKTATNIDTVYKSALSQHSIRPLAPSSNSDLKATFDTYEPKKFELRFSLPLTFNFNHAEDIIWIKHNAKFTWHTLKAILRAGEIKTAMLLTPVAWQLGPIYFQECAQANVVASAFDAGANISSAEVVLKNHPIQLLVTTSEALKSLLELNATLPKYIMIIEGWGRTPTLIAPDNCKVVYDIHLTPGVSIAFQDKHEVGGSFVCKPTADYLFVTEADKTFITTVADASLQLFHYELPVTATVATDAEGNQYLSYV